MVTRQIIRQLYDEQGRRLEGKGAVTQDVFAEGLLHGAVHVWIWRKQGTAVEVLLQKRAASKPTWPNRLDVTCAGHINLNELPVNTAEREAREEIGLPIKATDLYYIATTRSKLITQNGYIENEIQFMYLYELERHADFAIQMIEVDSLFWLPLGDFTNQYSGESFVGRGELYYRTVVEAIRRRATD